MARTRAMNFGSTSERRSGASRVAQAVAEVVSVVSATVLPTWFWRRAGRRGRERDGEREESRAPVGRAGIVVAAVGLHVERSRVGAVRVAAPCLRIVGQRGERADRLSELVAGVGGNAADADEAVVDV